MSVICGLDHLQLAIPPGGEGAARAFYGGVLELVEEPKPSELAGRGGCWFAAGSFKLHLGVEKPFAPQRKAHPAMLCAAPEALADRLTSRGHPVSWDEALPGRRRFFTEDPFGNRLEIMQDGHGFSQT